ncbi:hypothetical protein MesoLjLc_51680 [Mesorhizobium sp. L-8-10]|uniref:helix-turn-helix domain-containing protein n=1 Tax=Mesorhizobium sp. L-8-10 TaxID=2744523 RepID=UPI001925708D|nr:helix-turn-helix transcriptional regulator [Mesorhizobium sp. L-8-10]BCH33238.1 hypothetical protein MesoLjLc_51680 [Mesorhizobium sp. L-8-10]
MLTRKTKKRGETTPEQLQIGARIRELREILDLTQDQFAEKIGVSRGAVGNWEIGWGAKLENLQRIVMETDCSFDWLATGKGVPYPAHGIDYAISQLPPEDRDDLILDIKAMVKRRQEKYKAKSS